jgi:hypothetical protein
MGSFFLNTRVKLFQQPKLAFCKRPGDPPPYFVHKISGIFLIETKRNYDYTPYVTVISVGSIEFEKGGMRFRCNIFAKQCGRSLTISGAFYPALVSGIFDTAHFPART